MTMESANMDAPDILAACITHVPVNARVDQAIAAHRIAFSTPQQPEASQLAFYTLRAVVLARAPTLDDHKQQLDYLTDLPEAAWPHSADHTSQEMREATLAMIRRGIAWVSVCV